MSVHKYTMEAAAFFKKYSKMPEFIKQVPLKTGEGSAIRIVAGDKMGVFTEAGKILTFHPGKM